MDLTLTSKGQTTIPKEVREHLGVKPGDKVKCVLLPDGRAYLLPKRPLESLKGILHRPGRKPVTVEEMNEAIGRHVAEDDRRIVSEYNRDAAKAKVKARKR